MKAVLIGYGRMGCRYVQICKEMNLDLVAIFDMNRGKTDSNVNIFPSSEFYEFLQNNSIDIVIISTPCASHYGYLVKAIDRGIKYILCEKPFLSSLKQISHIKKIHIDSPSKIAVNHQMRFMSHYNYIKKVSLSGEMGSLSSISVQAGNFGLAMNGTHYFELLRYLSSSIPKVVNAWLQKQNLQNPRGAEYKDYSGNIRVVTENNCVLNLNIMENHGHGIFSTFTFERGQIFMDELSGDCYRTKRSHPEDIYKPSIFYGLKSKNEFFKVEPLSVIEPTKKVIASLINSDNYPSCNEAELTIKVAIAAICSADRHSISVNVKNIPPEYIDNTYKWA
ncbi:MAG: Gfo/Idh/MocA family oxidoreductase [Alphaproteobacteria bacterium]|nr:MAG: Gfo/Idh/MocA family oxidoreductase [Alphaproteobacteria bacterium]